ncbi:MAG: 23S rRNA (uracil(1939)-C(5))-methyltransferase RlmD [Cyanosarcina radialis HA8281-LM2]|nr:23S rRNA (uracil(1939)-C(5))-methyltransferase RlmD [Cyanosarcina radialis HA8281-LM2]
MNDEQLTLKQSRWRQGELVEITIADLNDAGEGVGRWENRVVFVPDTVAGDRVLVRLIRVKPDYAYGKLERLLEASSYRDRPSCIVADKCGGCQWQHISYEYQLAAKRQQIIQALERIGGFSQPPVAPVLAAAQPLHYRNKATYPLGRSATGQVQAGYYQKGSHQLINLNQCPVQDSRLNPLLAEVKRDIQRLGWQIYDEKRHQGQVRHLSLRIGRRTGEMLLTLVVTDGTLPEIAIQAQQWLDRYPQLVGVALNYNPKRTNAIFGDRTRCVAGKTYLHEEFANLQFQLRPETFFQVYTEQAEALLEVIIDRLFLQGNEILLDAYCGIGTFTLPLALRVREAIGLEVQATSVELARANARLNQINNVRFEVGAVEKLLPQLDVKPDIALLDPPRQGCDRAVLESLLQIQPQRIVYISCKPATLARDLKILCGSDNYQLNYVQPADFFPQTAHVECAAFLSAN